jgi:hypothetical protein
MPTRHWRTVGIDVIWRFSEMSLRGCAMRQFAITAWRQRRPPSALCPYIDSIFGRNAQTAVIPGRLRQGALKPFATRYPGKVLYPKSSVSRAGRWALAASTRSGFEVMKRRLLEAGQRLGGVMRSATAGMVQTSPGAHGKLSQEAVAEGRRIAFAVARKGLMRFARTSLSSRFLSSVRPSLLRTSSRAIEIALMSSGPLPPIRKTARCSLHSLPTQEVLATNPFFVANALPQWSARSCG